MTSTASIADNDSGESGAKGVASEAEQLGTEAIYNYRKVDDQIITGGQPTAGQLEAAAAEGVTTVINLATINPRYSLEDEAGLVQSLGMTYRHIPGRVGTSDEGRFRGL